MPKTEATIIESIDTEAQGKEVRLNIAKTSWTTTPAGAEFDHVLTLKINLNEEERGEVEDLFRHYWSHYAVLGGIERPKQAGLFDAALTDEKEEPWDGQKEV